MMTPGGLGADLCQAVAATPIRGYSALSACACGGQNPLSEASPSPARPMRDPFRTDPDDMHYGELADKVRYFKEDEEGVAAMSKVMEDMLNEEAERTQLICIENLMKNLKWTVEQAMDALGIPQSERSTYAELVGKKAL